MIKVNFKNRHLIPNEDMGLNVIEFFFKLEVGMNCCGIP